MAIVLGIKKPPPPTNDFSGDSDCLAVYKLDYDNGGVDGNVCYLDSQNSYNLNQVYTGWVSDGTTFKEGDGSLYCNGTGALGLSVANQDVNWPGSLLGGHDKTLVSWCYWVKFDTLAVNAFQHFKGIVGKFTSGKAMFDSNFGHGSDHKANIRMGSGNGSVYQISTDYYTPVVDDVWYHFQCSINGTTGAYWFRIWDDTAGAYLDGDGLGNPRTGTFTNTPGIILDTEDTDFRIGTGSGTYRHVGNIDEVVIWNAIKNLTDFNAVRAGLYGT